MKHCVPLQLVAGLALVAGGPRSAAALDCARQVAVRACAETDPPFSAPTGLGSYRAALSQGQVAGALPCRGAPWEYRRA